MNSQDRVFLPGSVGRALTGLHELTELGVKRRFCWRRHRVSPEFCFDFHDVECGSTEITDRADLQAYRRVGSYTNSLAPTPKLLCVHAVNGSIWIASASSATLQFVNSGVACLEQCFTEFTRLNCEFPHPVSNKPAAYAAWRRFYEYLLRVDGAITDVDDSYWLSQVGERLEGTGRGVNS